MKRRNNLDVSVDILRAATGGAYKTTIVEKSNLNALLIKGYLSSLTARGFLTRDSGGRYHTTKEGARFVEDYLSLIGRNQHQQVNGGLSSSAVQSGEGQ